MVYNLRVVDEYSMRGQPAYVSCGCETIVWWNFDGWVGSHCRLCDMRFKMSICTDFVRLNNKRA